MLVEPLYFSSVRIERQRRVGIEGVSVGSAGRSSPRFGLCRTPIDSVRFRIVAAGNPCVTTGAKLQWQVPPSVATGLTGAGDSRCSPDFLSGFRVVPGNEADVLFVVGAPRHTRDHLAANDDWAGSVFVSRFVIGDLGVPR